MAFPDALVGVKRIYASQALSVLALILGVTVGILEAIGGDTLLLAANIIRIAAAVLVVVALLIYIAGASRASRDESIFKTVIIVLIVCVAATVLEAVFGSDPLLSSFCNSISRITEFLASFFACTGLINLADHLGDTLVSSKGKRARTRLLGIWVASAVLKLLSAVFSNNERMTIAAVVVATIGSIVYVVAYYIYMRLLNRAKKMLARHPEQAKGAEQKQNKPKEALESL